MRPQTAAYPPGELWRHTAAYRGLATIQMGKAKQAKPDLEKVIQLAPDSNEAKEAKEYLKSIK